jgi:hypothetical protein
MFTRLHPAGLPARFRTSGQGRNPGLGQNSFFTLKNEKIA